LGVGIEVEAVVLWSLLGRIRGRNGAQSVQRAWIGSTVDIWSFLALACLLRTGQVKIKGSRMASKAF
jgi:hypothetical protein